jgi:hypothetical protein
LRNFAQLRRGQENLNLCLEFNRFGEPDGWRNRFSASPSVLAGVV